ncbi:hypothetical protein [Natrinema pallidum]|uniref:PGF-CTERM sorting domain-containing protein n=2 Tax=Natrinema pallidum TaxID=69527 RepID=L9YXN3_9EURY|nr:hypothetical protein [Natrinema pallidum]ELY77673.1 hypothetical protein C487_09613 [Natrinema pallidum DSM 3751]QCW05015.1 hypothetical protein FGF80_13855 [Natrinema pallidum]
MKSGGRAFLVVLLVAAVGIATIGLPAIYGGSTTTAEATESPVESYETVSQAESDLDPADEVYLRDDGSAVLRYDDNESDVNQVDLGMDASEGLVHMLVADDLDDEMQNEEFESADFSAILDQQGFAGNGSLVMQQPDEVTDLSVDVSGEISDERNQFDATAAGTFESNSTTTGEATTSGHMTATADRFETAGTISAESGTMAAGDDTSMSVSLEDTSDGYTIDVAQERSIYDFSAEQWETREAAKQTLQEQYGAIATQMGGTSDIQINEYEYEERTTDDNRLTLDFTVEYTGIDAGIEEQLATALANDDSSDLSQSEAETIAANITELEIETFEFTMNQSDGTFDVEWEIALANYDKLTIAMLDLAESTDMNGTMPQEDIDNARAAIDAQQKADLTWEMQWDASVEQTSGNELTLDAELTSETENWKDYIAELKANDIETPNDVKFDLTAETDGDKLSVDGQFEVESKDLAGNAINAMAESAQSGPTGSSNAQSDQFMTALSESELQVARIDGSITGDSVRVEAGAKFDNMSKVTETFSDTVSISGVATESDGNTTSMYVYVDDMGDVDTASATKSDIEHLGVVDSETTVHQAGDWDKEFPDVDTDGMRSYLGLNAENSEQAEGEDDSDSVPGFGLGVGLAAVAGLLTTLVLRRRE